jgi:hypothetical protein
MSHTTGLFILLVGKVTILSRIFKCVSFNSSWFKNRWKAAYKLDQL